MLSLLLIALAQAQPAPAPAPPSQTAPATILYVVSYKPGPAWVAGKPMHQQKLAPHAAYIRRLLEEGRLVAGGPYTDGDGGMAIFRAATLGEARSMLAADPAIVSGVFVAEMRPWQPRFDSKQPLTR